MADFATKVRNAITNLHRRHNTTGRTSTVEALFAVRKVPCWRKPPSRGSCIVQSWCSAVTHCRRIVTLRRSQLGRLCTYAEFLQDCCGLPDDRRDKSEPAAALIKHGYSASGKLVCSRKSSFIRDSSYRIWGP